ncbi:MAG: aldo/keto reductase [Betaproteobacteria bacterium]|nr:aldo/keto reductase [Betaproteobacteria bacterium]
MPRSGELLPAVGLGTYRTFDVGTSREERAPLTEVLDLFVQAGGTVVDTSPMYGRSEGVVGDLAAELGITKSLFLATKVWTTGHDAGIRQMEESFHLLRTERIDLMQVHNLLGLSTHLRTLHEWKASRKIRYFGITHYHEDAYRELERLLRSEDFDFLQINYSVRERKAEQTILPLAAERGVAVIVNRPFAQGNLLARVRDKSLPPWAADFDCTSWSQFFLKYILANRAVTCVVPATANPEHLVENMAVGTGPLPDEATRRRMVQLVESL